MLRLVDGTDYMGSAFWALENVYSPDIGGLLTFG